MDEAQLDIDRAKHVCYSKEAKRVMLNHLSLRYPAREAAAAWDKIQRQYVLYLSDLPYLGGKRNMRSGTGGTYDFIALMAFCAALPEDKRPSSDELFIMGCELALPPFKKLSRFINVNHPAGLRALNAAFYIAARKTQLHEAEWPDDYIMRMEPFEPAKGARYRFERCPLADFALAHGLLYLMPPMCNVDYTALELLHGTLLRSHTCANGSVCDYRVVGDEHPDARKYPRLTDEAGFWYNKSVR